MREWEKRPKEIQTLLNPAFCGRLLYAAIVEYDNKDNRHMPFPLLYLILPLVLHLETRQKINGKIFLKWVQVNQNLLTNFASRTRDLVEITNEAIEFLLCSGVIQLSERGEIGITACKKLRDVSRPNEEIRDCIQKSRHVAKWFIGAGTTQNIYYFLGIRP